MSITYQRTIACVVHSPSTIFIAPKGTSNSTKVYNSNDCNFQLLTDIYDGIPCLFVFLRPYFGLESQSGYQPLS